MPVDEVIEGDAWGGEEAHGDDGGDEHGPEGRLAEIGPVDAEGEEHGEDEKRAGEEECDGSDHVLGEIPVEADGGQDDGGGSEEVSGFFPADAEDGEECEAEEEGGDPVGAEAGVHKAAMPVSADPGPVGAAGGAGAHVFEELAVAGEVDDSEGEGDAEECGSGEFEGGSPVF